MSEWIEFVPNKDMIGMHARFKQCGICDGKYQENEIVGTIVDNPNPNPWHYDVAVGSDGHLSTLYYFHNGSDAFYDKNPNERVYLIVDAEWKYYYKEI